MQEYSFINLFRALAAFWVLAAHCMIWGGWYGIPLSPKLAVDLFMIISGFLMAANAYNRDSFEPLATFRNWCRFWLRRFFRVAPGYYLSLAIAATTSSFFLRGYGELQKLTPGMWGGSPYNPATISYDLHNILLHLSFLFGLHPTYSASTFLPDWSLSLEMQFYVVFPALLLIMRKRGFTSSALWIGAASLAIAFIIRRTFPYNEPSLLFLKLQYFIAGILLFRVLYGDHGGREKLLQGVCALILVSAELRYGQKLVFLPLLLFGLYFLGQLERCGKMPAWLSSMINCRTVRFASDTSYGVYLFHGFFLSGCGLILYQYPILMALTPPQRVGAIFIFVSTLTYLLAYFSLRCVELPAIRLGKHLIALALPLDHGPAPAAVDQKKPGAIPAET